MTVSGSMGIPGMPIAHTRQQIDVLGRDTSMTITLDEPEQRRSSLTMSMPSSLTMPMPSSSPTLSPSSPSQTPTSPSPSRSLNNPSRPTSSRAKIGLAELPSTERPSADAAHNTTHTTLSFGTPPTSLPFSLKPAVFAAGVDINTMPIVAGRLGERPQSEDHSAIERARRHNRSRHRDSVNGGGGGSGTDLTLPAAPPSFHALPAPPVALPAAPSAHPARPSHLDDDPDGLLPPMDDGSDEEAAVADIPPAAKVLHAACPFCSEEGEVDANPDQRINVIRCSSCTKVYGVPTPEELLSDSASRPFSARFRPGSARPGSARPGSARSVRHASNVLRRCIVRSQSHGYAWMTACVSGVCEPSLGWPRTCPPGVDLAHSLPRPVSPYMRVLTARPYMRVLCVSRLAAAVVGAKAA